MKTIKATSQKGRQLKANYFGAMYNELYQIYDKCSMNKIQAMHACKDMMIRENGKDLKILSWNTFHFTCAWKTEKGIRVETAKNSYLIMDEK